jgi:hypothetical protein
VRWHEPLSELCVALVLAMLGDVRSARRTDEVAEQSRLPVTLDRLHDAYLALERKAAAGWPKMNKLAERWVARDV